MSPTTLPLHSVLAAALLALCATQGRANGSIEVAYVHPEKFADIGWGRSERERALDTLTEIMNKLGARLPDNQTLRLEVLDVDLAGRIWMGSLRELRVLRGTTDWPQITLRYTLLEGGKAVKAGEDRLTDMGYMFSRLPGTALEGNLPYEKRMIDQWFSGTFGVPAR